ncbi:MAG: hypothetical protein LBT74_02520 [Acidobacteriota bacterium]|nr:hypothetical protein [Acidobacteriota bacterium]
MNKVYHVVIKGKTLESRDLGQLLSRAVAEKRTRNRMLIVTPFIPSANNLATVGTMSESVVAKNGFWTENYQPIAV